MQRAIDGLENNIPEILFEDDQLLFVAKPAGLVVHSDGRTNETSLAEWLIARYPTITEVGGLHTLDSARYVPRVGIVHRLDRETSGVIVIAKDDATFYILQRQFLDRSVSKEYVAFVRGIVVPPEGVIDFPIGRSRTDFRRWTTGAAARGTLRPALTNYERLSTHDGYSYVQLSPKTGRTHQLRVHMQAIGFPIVCDARYGEPPALGFTRLALHALTLRLVHPNGTHMNISAPLPADFRMALTHFPE